MHEAICAMSKIAILGMVIPPFNRNPYNGYINPYYWVDDHPLLYGNNWSLDPGTYHILPWTSKYRCFRHILGVQSSRTSAGGPGCLGLWEMDMIVIESLIFDYLKPV